jgi:NAD(P)-dependent dehydrogenase (short-subunit alcohol dehydrogenase family)
MNIQNKTILITGANRGIGRALVTEALRRGAKRVYAGTRSGELQNADSRVTPLMLDVTNTAQIQAAVENVEALDLLINNAGVALYDDLSDRATLEQSLAVNFFGMHGMTQAFLPLLRRSKGAIVNNLSLAALAPLPIIPGYSISKAAAANMTQSFRALLAGQDVTVHAVFLGPIDTDMNRGFDIPKASPESAAQGIFDGLEKREEDIFPDPASLSVAEGWRMGVAKALERQFGALVPDARRPLLTDSALFA